MKRVWDCKRKWSVYFGLKLSLFWLDFIELASESGNGVKSKEVGLHGVVQQEPLIFFSLYLFYQVVFSHFPEFRRSDHILIETPLLRFEFFSLTWSRQRLSKFIEITSETHIFPVFRSFVGPFQQVHSLDLPLGEQVGFHGVDWVKLSLRFSRAFDNQKYFSRDPWTVSWGRNRGFVYRAAECLAFCQWIYWGSWYSGTELRIGPYAVWFAWWGPGFPCELKLINCISLLFEIKTLRLNYKFCYKIGEH